jgi:tryptophan-rich sensory protein
MIFLLTLLNIKMTDTEKLLYLILFFVYYFLWGIVSYCYFKLHKKDTKESWKLYIFFYGMRLRIAFSAIFAVFTKELFLYGIIRIISGQ